MFDVVQDTVGDLYTELQSFTKFRDRIDELLQDLKASPADAKKVGEDRVAPTEFGDVAWTEAQGLYGSYKTVITELENLSKMLSDSIEGMGIAVLASHKGYENMDEDIRARMRAISGSTEEHYGGEYVPDEPSAKSAEPTPTPQETSADF
ncbi:hypothetical protein F0344_22710 [Streptomyces finlayi]|uniref:Uncharacterized protein n=1 Tax=Streptomyces finlayi TaxID=67296 RepID=A0A7G7BVL5_9ACTN|nr:hypothetical protein F0344_22710 [Streptomyces finlayi]